jgi:hypothetical protein
MSEPTQAISVLVAAQLNVERAAREVDALFGGDFGRWTLDGRVVTDEASIPLLSLHDYLNDVAVARKALNSDPGSTEGEAA